MMGETVAVLFREEAGTDAMGEPVYRWSPLLVGNVLVRPLDGSDIQLGSAVGQQRPDGIRSAYRLAFPKTYGGPPLAHARVALVDRGMDASDAGAAYRVVGSPDVTRPCPTAWNMHVEVGRADG